MTITVAFGIGLAFIAMLSWGFGDFFIQRSTRKVGDWETLFILSLFSMILLAPFMWHSMINLFVSGNSGIYILLIASVILFVAALLDLEALRVGKLAIVEPVWSFEIPAAALLAFFILHERISLLQIGLIIVLMIGLMLLAFKGRISKSLFFERGIILAFVSAITMGCANFFMGWGGRVTDPLMVNFFTDTFLTVACALYLIHKRRLGQSFKDIRRHFSLLIPMAIADKIAWVAFVFSMSMVSIGVVTAISESYIIIAVILGLFINKEKLQIHQKIGLVGAIATAITLAVITSV